jgi:hypothetical protein
MLINRGRCSHYQCPFIHKREEEGFIPLCSFSIDRERDRGPIKTSLNEKILKFIPSNQISPKIYDEEIIKPEEENPKAKILRAEIDKKILEEEYERSKFFQSSQGDTEENPIEINNQKEIDKKLVQEVPKVELPSVEINNQKEIDKKLVEEEYAKCFAFRDSYVKEFIKKGEVSKEIDSLKLQVASLKDSNKLEIHNLQKKHKKVLHDKTLLDETIDEQLVHIHRLKKILTGSNQ